MKKLIIPIFMLISNVIASQTFLDFPAISSRTQGEESIELKCLDISVYVTENIATTTLEMQFYNNNNRVMEGELNFPLAEGVTVSRFALDVNGEMREGVVVEKEKATQAFEIVTRRKIDPGLVEVTSGNNFKARVYPIPAKGYKKAIIAFEQELSGDENNYYYQMPVNFKHKLEEFSVKAEVVMNKPKTIKSDEPFINLNFTDNKNTYVSEYHENDILLNTQLSFLIPRPDKVNKVLTYKGAISPDNYFYINLNPSKEYRSKSKPSSITIIWDESMSGKNRDIEKEKTILRNYIEWMQEGTIELITFSNTLHTKNRFLVKDGKCNEIIARLKSTNFDGATNLGAIDFKSISSEEIVLFTDGISNFGKKPLLHFSSPIIAINSSNTSDHNILEYFASASNGIYANAFKLTNEEVFNLITNQQKRFIKAEYDKQNITEFYPKTGQAIIGSFSCSGKTEGALNEIQLHFGYGNTITETHIITVDNTNRIENNIGERIWAQKKLKSLLAQGDDDEIKKHGKKYSLVTPGTSLIVLDNVEDYVRYEITPPESLLKEYNTLVSEQRKNNTQTRLDRLDRICKEFKEDIKWWKSVSDYRYQPEPKQEANLPTTPPQVSEELMIVDDNIEMDNEVEFLFIEEAEMAENAFMPVTRRQESGMPARESSSTQLLSSSMSIKEWSSNAQYMSDLKAVDPNKLYKTYLILKPQNEENPSFYFDVASYMFQKSKREDGLRVISNLAELELENSELLRTLGRKLSEHAFYEEAIFVFDKVLSIRSFEPHSYIDLGTTFAQKGEYQKAIDNLYTVIEKNWDNDIIARFPGIETIVLHDINNIVYHQKDKLNISKIKDCFIKHMPVDVRVVIDWDANDTDIDLWITDPNDEKCSYQNKETRIGGKISNDITRGYGLEEFRLKYAPEGKYIVEVNFFGSNKQTVMGNVTVRAIVYTSFGSENEHKEILTLQLPPDKTGNFIIGELKFEK